MKMRGSYQSPRQQAHVARQPSNKSMKGSSISPQRNGNGNFLQQQRSFQELNSENLNIDYDDSEPVDISSLNLAEIQNKLTDMHDENKLLKINLNNEMSIRQRLERKNHDLNEKLNDARQGLQETRNALLKVQTATEQMISKRDQRENQLKKVITINKSYENRIAELEEKLSKAVTDSKGAAKLAGSKQLLSDKDNIISDLEDQLQQLQTQLVVCKRDNKRLLDEKSNLEFLHESAQQKVIMLESKVRAVDRNHKQLTVEYENTEQGYPSPTGQSDYTSPMHRNGSNFGGQQQQPSAVVPDVDLIHRLVETKLSSFLNEKMALESRMHSLESMLRDSQSKATLLTVQQLQPIQQQQQLLPQINYIPQQQQQLQPVAQQLQAQPQQQFTSVAPVSQAPVAVTASVPIVDSDNSKPSSVKTTRQTIAGNTSKSSKIPTSAKNAVKAVNALAAPVAAANETKEPTKSRKIVSSEPVTKFVTPQQQYLNDAIAAVTSPSRPQPVPDVVVEAPPVVSQQTAYQQMQIQQQQSLQQLAPVQYNSDDDDLYMSSPVVVAPPVASFSSPSAISKKVKEGKSVKNSRANSTNVEQLPEGSAGDTGNNTSRVSFAAVPVTNNTVTAAVSQPVIQEQPASPVLAAPQEIMQQYEQEVAPKIESSKKSSKSRKKNSDEAIPSQANAPVVQQSVVQQPVQPIVPIQTAPVAVAVAPPSVVSSEDTSNAAQIANLKTEIAEMTAQNKKNKAVVNKFTDEFTAENGRKPTKDDRRIHAKEMFSIYHKTAREIKKKQKMLAKFQNGGKLMSGKSMKNLDGGGGDDDDSDDSDD